MTTIFRHARAIGHEVAGSLRIAPGRDGLRLIADCACKRVMKSSVLRQIRTRSGATIVYRPTRGDIQSIREVWMDGAYRLPFDLRPETVLDLGANIGLTSVWLAHTYGARQIVAVEPDRANATIAARNFEANRAPATLVEAAVGPEDGEGFFQIGRESNIGTLTTEGVPVRVASPGTLLRHFPDGVDLVKMDIEGGEQPLLMSDLSWLSGVRSMIVEFHPGRVDYPGLIARVEGAGFRYIPSGSRWRGSMDAFVRHSA